MPTFDEIRQLVSRSRLLVQQERAHLRRLKDELAETQCVIERATIAYTSSDRLLRMLDGNTLGSADHKATPEPPRPHSFHCPCCKSPMVWYNADLINDHRALRHSYQCGKCGSISQWDDQGWDAGLVELAKG
jgi:predicted RNA-binding Zn-ribbon protein involved in translation (DUF1610 family)